MSDNYKALLARLPDLAALPHGSLRGRLEPGRGNLVGLHLAKRPPSRFWRPRLARGVRALARLLERFRVALEGPGVPPPGSVLLPSPPDQRPHPTDALQRGAFEGYCEARYGWRPGLDEERRKLDALLVTRATEGAPRADG